MRPLERECKMVGVMGRERGLERENADGGGSGD